MKFLLGGGAALAGTLIASSFLIFVPTSIAEPLHQTIKDAPTKQEPKAATDQQGNKEDLGKTENKAVVTDTLSQEAKVPVTEAKTSEAVNKALTPPVLTPVEEAKLVAPPVSFTATAYSLYGKTASGAPVRKGMIAADRSVLPIGTKVRVESGTYTGEYEVCDTGGAVRGKRIDVWVPSTREAMRFGRRTVKLTVLSYPKHAVRSRTPRRMR